MSQSNPLEYLNSIGQESIRAKEDFIKEHGKDLVQVAQRLSDAFHRGGKLLIMGNGGSAADAQHMAAELVGRLLMERRPLPAIALTTDTSNLTAIGNDYGYDHIFVKQVQALAQRGDVIVALSTSGNSKNVLLATEAAKERGCFIVSLTGGTGGKLKAISDICLNVRLGENSCRIQETHIFAIHSMVDLLDRYYLDRSDSGPSGNE